MYQETAFINSNEVDDHFDLKVSSIFKYMQQVSTNHSELIGLGKEYTDEKEMFWVITRIHVVILKMPKMLDTLTIKTHPGNNILYVFPRYYQIYDQYGDLCINASASWVLLDSNSRKVVNKPLPEGFTMPVESYPEDLKVPMKVNVDSLNKVESRKVRYSDIDLNGHLNNAKYIDYIIDIHDSNFYKSKRVKEILINYEKEVNNNDIIDLFNNLTQNEIVVGEVNGIRAFSARIEYEDRDD